MQKKCSENSQNWVNHDKNASKAKKNRKMHNNMKRTQQNLQKMRGKSEMHPPLQFLSDQIFTLTNPLQAEQYQTTQTLFLQKGNHQKYIHITKKWNIGLIHVGREWTHNDFGWFWLLCDIQPGSLSWLMKAQTCGLWFGPHIPGPVHFLRWNHATQTGKSWIKPGEVNFTFGMRFQKHNPSNNIWNGTFFASKQLSEAGRGTTIVNPKFVPAHNSTLVGGVPAHPCR